MAEWFENLVNKDYLQDNLTFASLFIALYCGRSLHCDP